MKKLILYAFCLFIGLLTRACHSDLPPSCDVKKPLEELSWLKTIVADTAATSHANVYIYQDTYKNHMIYRVEVSLGVDAGVTTLYDCQGAVLCKGYTTIGGFQSDCRDVFNATKSGPLLYQR